jgi:hypothetical protein
MAALHHPGNGRHNGNGKRTQAFYRICRMGEKLTDAGEVSQGKPARAREEKI